MIHFLKTISLFVLLSNAIYPTIPVSNDPPISVQKLVGHWKLDKYKVSFFTEAPSSIEQNDYIHLKTDRSFDAISEGKRDHGNWRLDVPQKRIYLSKQDDDGELVFIIDQLTAKKLVLTIDAPTDSDAQYLKIHFKKQ